MPAKPKEISLAQVKAFTEKIKNDSHELELTEEEKQEQGLDWESEQGLISEESNTKSRINQTTQSTKPNLSIQSNLSTRNNEAHLSNHKKQDQDSAKVNKDTHTSANRTHELYDLAEILKTLPIENKLIQKRERGRPRHNSDLVQLNVLIPKEHRLLLQYVAEQEDLSLNQITRRAIQQYLVVNLDVLGIESEDIGVALMRDGKSKETRTNRALYNSVEENRNNLPRLDLPAASANIDENSLFEDLNPDYR